VQLVVDGGQLLVGRLKLLFRRLQLLVHTLQLFVAGDELFVGRGQIVIGTRMLFDERLEILLRRGELVLQLGEGAPSAWLAFALALRLALQLDGDAVFEEHEEEWLLDVGNAGERRHGYVASLAAAVFADEHALFSHHGLRLLRLQEGHPQR
jgi:hypothetical protein